MGNFYTNVTVRTTEPEGVLRLLTGRQALVTPPLGPDVVVYDERLEDQDARDLEALARYLSRECATLAWGVLNHDDDLLQIILCDRGDRRFSWSSAGPGSIFAFRRPRKDPPAALCQAFGLPGQEAEVAAILGRGQGADGYTFEVDRHAALASALGWPDASVGFGYRYVTQGELPSGLTLEQLLAPG